MKPLRETRLGRAFIELFWDTPVWPYLRKLKRGLGNLRRAADPAARAHDERQRKIVQDFDAETTTRSFEPRSEQHG